ncbi:MAG: hypothetical protein R3B48_08975 [Kofleriaceae bacterium]
MRHLSSPDPGRRTRAPCAAVALTLALAACGPAARPDAPAPLGNPPPAPTPAAPAARGCSEAAAGVEGGTRGIRGPDSTVLTAIRARCLEDAWPAAAVDCFALMTEGELGACAGRLPRLARQRMFAVLGSGGADDGEATDARSSELALALAAAKLRALHVQVAACDALIETATRALACEAIPATERVRLGAELADFWSLPDELPASARRQMDEVCGKWHPKLVERVLAAGCMP